MMVWVWLGLLAFFVIVEACTANLLTIWFAAGALVALISSFFIENPMIQVVIFVIVSLIVLVALSLCTAACQASLSIANSRSSLRLMCIESVMPSSHLILCHPLLPPMGGGHLPCPSQHQSLFQ